MRVTGEGWLLGAALLQRPHLLALHQLLIKGLFNQDTQLITVQVNAPFAGRALIPGIVSVRLSTWLHKAACLTQQEMSACSSFCGHALTSWIGIS